MQIFKNIPERLKEFPFFKNLDNNEIEILAREVVERFIPKGQVFIEQDGNDDSVYFVVSGYVKIYRINADGKVVNLALIGPGETIGEMSPIFGNPRTAFCEAQSDVSVLVLSGDKFRNKLKSSSEIMMAFMKNFCERLSSANRYIEDILSLKLKDRTMSLLNTLSKMSAESLDITQEEIATILNATRPRVSEVLQELEKEGKIVISHRKIKVL